MQFASETTTITIINKISGYDNDTGKDIFYKTVIPGCAWVEQIDTITADMDVKYIRSVVCRIPASPDYKPYKKFIKDPIGFTINVNDYIVKGQLTEDVSSGVLSFIDNYDYCHVQAFKENCMGVFNHYKIIGN